MGGSNIRILESIFALALTLTGCALNAAPTVPAGPPDNTLANAEPLTIKNLAGKSPYQPDIESGPLPARCAAAPPTAFTSKPGFTEFGLTARDSSDNAIENLKQSDFIVTVDGKSVPIAMFSDSGPATSIVVVVDTSGSMAPKLPWVNEGLTSFLEKLPAQDPVALFAFSSRPFLLQPFTIHHSMVIAKLRLLHAYGQTATFDTLEQAAGMLGRDGTSPNKAILLITDGIDNSSSATAPDAANKIKQGGISLFAVGIGDPSLAARTSLTNGPFALSSAGDAERVDVATLQALANGSGGKFWLVRTGQDTTAADFAKTIDAAVYSLGGSYSVGVILPLPVKHHATVHFAIKDRPEAKISICEAVQPTPPAAATATSSGE